MEKRRLLATTALLMLLMGALAAPAAGHVLGPCNDGDVNVGSVADGATGRDYAAHHIAAMAKEGLLGGDGHVPGDHQGFAVCNPSGR